MQKSRKYFTYAAILSVLFFVVGYYFSSNFFEMMLPSVEGVQFQADPFGSYFYTSLLYGFVFSTLPIAIFLVCKIAVIESFTKKLIAVAIIIICSIGALFIRHEIIKSYLEKSTDFGGTNPSYQVLFPVSKLYFEYYMLCGVIVGTIISYYLLKKRNT